MYRVSITYKILYPFEDKEEYYKETLYHYKDNYIDALKIYEESKGDKDAYSSKIERIEKVEEWVNEKY